MYPKTQTTENIWQVCPHCSPYHYDLEHKHMIA